MIGNIGDDKLETFRQEILGKAQAEKAQILAETERLKKEALDQEETLLLETLYSRMQAEIARIKTDNVKVISRETQALKKQLYAQREQYLSELVAAARTGLRQFADGPDYEAYLLRQIGAMAEGYRFGDSVVKVRSKDLPLAGRIREIYGDCRVEADDGAVAIGGAVLENAAHGILLELTLDAALADQKERFYHEARLHIDGEGSARQ